MRLMSENSHKIVEHEFDICFDAAIQIGGEYDHSKF